MNLCAQKTKNEIQKEDAVQDVLAAYSDIVDKIISSPSPANEDFETQLVAIYNCLERRLGPGAEGEQRAVQVLTQKQLTGEQVAKCYGYLSSKGRNVNTGRIVAGLPAGDKSISCADIN